MNEAFGERLSHHWIDGFAIEIQTQENTTTDTVQYLPNETAAPMSFMVAKTINGKTSMPLLRALFDSGGNATMIHERCLPKNYTPTFLTNLVT